MAKLEQAPNNFRGVRIKPEALKRLYEQKGFSPSLTPIPPMKTLVMPSKRITSPDFEYTPARATNVAETWRKHGWKAPLKPHKAP